MEMFGIEVGEGSFSERRGSKGRCEGFSLHRGGKEGGIGKGRGGFIFLILNTYIFI